MKMKWALITMSGLCNTAQADALEDWVKAKVARQLQSLESPTPPQLPPPAAAPDLHGFRGPPSFGPLVKAVRGAVVGLSTRNVGTSTSLGSGFLISATGLVVTNRHVVAKAETITARLADGRLFEADLIGADASTDLAVLKLAGARGLPAVAWGDSDRVGVGDWVLVIGKPLGLEATVTHGIVSAEDRALGAGPYDEFIQISADINPGNSGGPLFDMRGEVVGVTTLASRAGQGVAFAVPSNLVQAVVPQLVARGSLRRGWVGLSVDERDDSLVVREVYPASPAAAAGVRPGDVLETVAGKPVEGYREALRRISLQPPGSELKLGLSRQGKSVTALVVVSDRARAD